METVLGVVTRRHRLVTNVFRTSFNVASARCEFKTQIRDERRITVSVWVSRIGDRSWDLDYSIHGPRGVQYAVGRTTQVAYDYKARSAVKISVSLKKKLAKHFEAPVKFRGTG